MEQNMLSDIYPFVNDQCSCLSYFITPMLICKTE